MALRSKYKTNIKRLIYQYSELDLSAQSYNLLPHIGRRPQVQGQVQTLEVIFFAISYSQFFKMLLASISN